MNDRKGLWVLLFQKSSTHSDGIQRSSRASSRLTTPLCPHPFLRLGDSEFVGLSLWLMFQYLWFLSPLFLPVASAVTLRMALAILRAAPHIWA
jgi:hypothetical protein